MSQSLAQLYTHLVFSTKNRTPWIRPNDYDDICSYLGGILNKMESPSLVIGSVTDHVHILYRHSKNHALKKVIEEVKTGSSKWIKTKGNHYSSFYWQAGYGAFSVSSSKIKHVREYIVNQEEHHKRVSFQEEYRRFLKEYIIEYDERYVWD